MTHQIIQTHISHTIGICICGHYRVYDDTECPYCLESDKAVERLQDLLELGFDPYADVTLLRMVTVYQIQVWIREVFQMMVPFEKL